MKYVRCVVFDAVGTLIHPVEPVAKTYAMAGQRFGCVIDQAIVSDRFAKAFRAALEQRPSLITSEQQEREFWSDVVSAVFVGASDTVKNSVLRDLWHHFADSNAWQLYDDVVPTLQMIRDLGIGVAIGSNFDSRLRPVIGGLLPSASVNEVFDSASIGFRKPSLEPVSKPS